MVLVGVRTYVSLNECLSINLPCEIYSPATHHLITCNQFLGCCQKRTKASSIFPVVNHTESQVYPCHSPHNHGNEF